MQVPYCQMPEAKGRSPISRMLSCYPVNMACTYYTIKASDDYPAIPVAL